MLHNLSTIRKSVKAFILLQMSSVYESDQKVYLCLQSGFSFLSLYFGLASARDEWRFITSPPILWLPIFFPFSVLTLKFANAGKKMQSSPSPDRFLATGFNFLCLSFPPCLVGVASLCSQCRCFLKILGCFFLLHRKYKLK